MLKKQYKNIILEICNKHLGVTYDLYLFGSRARGDDAFYSDIDLAIKSKVTKDKKDKLALIREDLEESTIPFTVDLVDIDHIDDNLKKSIHGEGILLNG